jgi:hypothetical protein
MRDTLAYLLKEGLIQKTQADKLSDFEVKKPMSIFWHVRVIMYLGITLLASGLGTLIYKNIDSIGHVTIVSFIGLLSAACFFYCWKKGAPFSLQKTTAPNAWHDYILLLGVLTFLSLEGYLQFEFDLFGSRYGLATIIPTVVLLFVAYRFDHLGILSMAITLFATWIGISLTPRGLLEMNDFSDERIVQAGLMLGVILSGTGYLLGKKDIKKHFDFTYYNFAFHLAAFAVFGATFNFDYGALWVLLISPIVVLGYYYAIKNQSFYFLLFSFAYSYIALTFLIIKGMFSLSPDGIIWAYLLFIYFIASAVLALKFLRKTYKSMTVDARI